MGNVGLTETMRDILKSNSGALTPQDVRDIIKIQYQHLYNTASHKKNVENGNYKDVDHALLAQIYTASQVASDIYMDRSTKPLTITLYNTEESDEDGAIDGLSLEENISRIESGSGTLYVLGTSTYTKDRKEIVKIGITSGDIEKRVKQLYTTNSPYKYVVIEKHDVCNPEYLEKAVHNILFKFRVNKAREFFSADCIPLINKIVDIYNESSSNTAAV
jgi:hypothetical protein